ncbi:MAG: GHMP kinase [bacterium]|nr:GHMP kinase [bacterium]
MTSLFVPGRLCLLGEHSDWAGAYRRTHPAIVPGRCLVTATDQGLGAEAEPLDDALELASMLPDGTHAEPVRLPLRSLADAARAGGFWSYAAGVASIVRERWDVGGLRLRIVANDLPLGKGLSSSAAVSVLVARAFARTWGLDVDVREEMRLAYAGERRAGSACGLMDQVCAFGRRTTRLDFDGAAFDVRPIPVGAPLHLLVVDLRAAKDTRRILADLNACYPAAPGTLAAGVRDALGPGNLDLVERAEEALAAGDAAALGATMAEAQALFDARVAPACPELRAPRLHAVLEHPAVTELAYGGKGVGSQGDGCAQLVARDPAARDALAARLAHDLGVATLPLTMAPAAAAA